MDDLLQRVYRQFDTGPLKPGDEALYVDLDPARGEGDVVRRLANRIRLSDRPICEVLAGHKGSGKSTELFRLQQELERTDSDQPRFFVVFCTADDDIDRNDVDFHEVLVAVVRQTAAQLKERADISLKPGYFKDRFERLKTLLGSEIGFEGVELSAGFLTLSQAIKQSPDARFAVRKLLEPDTSNWITAANAVLDEAYRELQKKSYDGLVVIVDDLDKMVVRPHEKAGCKTDEYLFVHRAPQLTAFRCHVVYSMPISLGYSRQQTIDTLYGGRTPLIPMVKVRTQPPNSRAFKDGVERLQNVIERRLTNANATPGDVFANDQVLASLVQLSGGQPDELMRLVRDCAIAKGLPIDQDALDRARWEGRRAFERQLRGEHWPILEEAHQTGKIRRSAVNEALVRELLEERALLLYVNKEEWYGLNPYLTDLLPSPRRRAKKASPRRSAKRPSPRRKAKKKKR